MTSIEEADGWIGRTAVDNTGEQMGMITQIWVDDTSGQPEWASVRVPALRGGEALVPLAGAAPLGGGAQFAYSKEEIVDAPEVAQDGRLEVADKERIASYYGAPDAVAPAGWSEISTYAAPPAMAWSSDPPHHGAGASAPEKAKRSFRRDRPQNGAVPTAAPDEAKRRFRRARPDNGAEPASAPEEKAKRRFLRKG